ncbi:MAG: hypothetical protein LBI60_03615 [Bacteroidales bacterium]|jgi:hypothetical protein|nr:hypothetical protein [Bacteroidales bacterium]
MNQKELTKYLLLLEEKLKKIYGSAYKEITKIREVRKAIEKGDSNFSFKENTAAYRKLQEIVSNLYMETKLLITRGMNYVWNLGKKNYEITVVKAFANEERAGEIKSDAEKGHRSNAMTAQKLSNENRGGMNLSERVWNLNGNAKSEIETIIQNGIKEGKTSDEISRSVTKYLNNPDALYRRVRNEKTGNLELSKAAKNYHPGQGVYRSAYKNAMRLLRTEVNRAYRRAEWESYQNDPLIVGFHVVLSNNHTTLINGKIVPLVDICDELQGEYPKSFLFEGWHPHCRCAMLPITIDNKDLKAYWNAKQKGKLDKFHARNEVKDVPAGFKNWIEKNKDRIHEAAKAGKLPYWMVDNKSRIEGITGTLTINLPIHIPSDMFRLYKKLDNGGRIEVMNGYTRKSDHKDLLSIAREFAKMGNNVQITTNPHYKSEAYKSVFGKLFGTKYERKCPDLIVNGKYYEYESYKGQFNKRKISNMITHGTKQSSRIIINNNKGCSDMYIGKNIHNRVINKKQEIDEVWVYEKGKIRLVYKKK